MLRFNKDGKFKIMQITDTQEVPSVSKDTISLIENALDRENPDLVVFTGDQIKGYSSKYKNRVDLIARTIDILVAPIVKRNIPFMVTYGNHDAQAGLSNYEQYEKVYSKYPNFISGNIRTSHDVGTSDIQIKSSDGTKNLFNLYLIDSHSNAASGRGYAPVNKHQIDWYISERERLKKENGDYLPSLVFQHIPVPEFYDGLKQTKKSAVGAVEAYGLHENEFYVLNEKSLKEGGFMGESPATPDVNTGEFDAMAQKGDVIGIYVGHDHNNSFVTNVRGVDLGYTQGCGFNVYGPGENRGVRVIELNENEPRKYTTRTVTYKEVCNTPISTPVQEFVYKHAPTSIRKAKPLILKTVAVVAACGVAYGVYKHYKNKG